MFEAFLKPHRTVHAHCDLPCGVYDPAQARIEAESVKAIQQRYQDADKFKTAAELLAEWRAAERDTVAAGSASRVAAMALEAAAAAEEAADEVGAAASAALEAVERATAAADRAKKAALHAAGAAHLALTAAEGDTAQAKQDLEEARHAEDEARDRFHEGEVRGFRKGD